MVEPEKRLLPQLVKGQFIKHNDHGRGEVIRDENESSGTCMIKFDNKPGTGVRELHMGLSHSRIKII